MNRVVEPVIPVTVTSPPSPSGQIFPVTINRVLRWPVMVFLHGLWTNYNTRRQQVITLFTLGEEEDIMKPGSPLSFVILGLLSFTAIKSQGESGFPFRTYPHASMVAVTSLLLYGLFSAAQRGAIIGQLGRKGSLSVLDHRHPRIQNLTPVQPPSRYVHANFWYSSDGSLWWV